MKIICLYPSANRPSHARYRVQPYARLAEEQGVDISCLSVPTSFFGRYLFFKRLPRADVYLVHRELLSALELQAVKRLCDRVVYDFSDAVWLPSFFNSHVSQSKAVHRFERLCRKADACVVDNRAQAERISSLQKQVHVVSTVPEEVLPTSEKTHEAQGFLRVGWLGDAMDQEYLASLLGTMENVGAYRYSLVSHKPYGGPGSEYAFWTKWSEEREAVLLREMDVGLAPVQDDELGRASTGLTVLRYMAAGIVVIASDVGRAPQLIDHGIDGFLVRSGADLQRYLDRLANDHELLMRMAQAAREKVQKYYCPDSLAPQMWKVLGISKT